MPPTLQPLTVTQLTPDGRGAVATLAVSGPGSAELVDRFFRNVSAKRVRQLAIDSVRFGQWQQPHGVSEDVVLVPRSDRQIEISCHGGVAAANAIMRSLEDAGATRAESFSWISAATNGRLEAEAWRALAKAKTDRVAGVLLDQLRGSLRRALEKTLSLVHAGDLRAARLRLDLLLRQASLGLHLTTPWRVVVAGAPNVGKSRLVNQLVGYERAIVFDEPGTTRDVLTASTAFDGWPFDLLDTAGVRDSSNGVEQEGISRAQQVRSSADLTLLIVDAQLGPAQLGQQPARDNLHELVVANKQDLAERADWPEHVICTSAITGAGIANLTQQIVTRLVPDPPAAGAPVVWTETQRSQLRAALSALDESNQAHCQHCLQALLA